MRTWISMDTTANTIKPMTIDPAYFVEDDPFGIGGEFEPCASCS